MGNLFVFEGTTNPEMKKYVKHEMLLSYDTDNDGVYIEALVNGNRNLGFTTSKIVDINDNDNLVVHTANSVYEFRKVE